MNHLLVDRLLRGCGRHKRVRFEMWGLLLLKKPLETLAEQGKSPTPSKSRPRSFPLRDGPCFQAPSVAIT